MANAQTVDKPWTHMEVEHAQEGKMSQNHQVHVIGDSKKECPPLFGWECHGEQENKINFFFLEMGYGTANTGKW